MDFFSLLFIVELTVDDYCTVVSYIQGTMFLELYHCFKTIGYCFTHCFNENIRVCVSHMWDFTVFQNVILLVLGAWTQFNPETVRLMIGKSFKFRHFSAHSIVTNVGNFKAEIECLTVYTDAH